MAATSPIERLPVELKLQLLPFLTDVQSLRSTILTCPSLYNAFMQYESLITTRVLRRQMPHEVLPEAIAAWKSSRVQPANREIVHDFVEEHFRVRRSRPKPLSLFEAIGVVKLHSCVEHFTDDFATLMFEESSRFSQIGSPPAWPLSRHEVMRIQRALYRFEVYGNLFRDGELFKWQEQRDLFFSKFSYWENEQLGCVRDYLYRIACPGLKPAVSTS